MNALRDVAKTAIVMPFPSENDAPLLEAVTLQLQRSEALSITTAEDYEQAGDVLKGLAGIVKRIGEFFDDDIAAANKIHKSLTGKKRQALEKVQARIDTLKRFMGDYVQAQERLRLAAEREAQAAARKAEEDRVAREAAALEAAGDKQLAADVIEQHIATPAPVVHVASTTPKVSGVSTVEAWNFEIVNAALLPREHMIPNEKSIRGIVNALKGAARIPGVRIFRQDQVRVRA